MGRPQVTPGREKKKMLINLGPTLIGELDDIYDKVGYNNRSELIRDAIRHFIELKKSSLMYTKKPAKPRKKKLQEAPQVEWLK